MAAVTRWWQTEVLGEQAALWLSNPPSSYCHHSSQPTPTSHQTQNAQFFKGRHTEHNKDRQTVKSAFLSTGSSQYRGSQRSGSGTQLTLTNRYNPSALTAQSRVMCLSKASVQDYLVKDSECLTDFFFAICIFHFSSHHGQELWEVNGAISFNHKKKR